MSTFRLMLAEACGRPMNFVLCWLAVTLGGVLFLGGPTLLSGYSQETDEQLLELQTLADRELARIDDQTRRIMRDLGVNLRIVHQDTNLGDLYTDFRAVDFPETYVDTLATAPQIETIVHLIATLQQKFTWQGRSILLIGMRPVLTQSQKNEEKKHMVTGVQPGTVLVGHELGQGLRVGETVEIGERTFKIAAIQPESGTQQDIQLVLNLADAQAVTHLPGRIHQIMALNCKCKGDRISVIRKELEGVLPDTKVTEHQTRATAREQQRELIAQNHAEQIKLHQANRERVLGSLAAAVNFLLPTGILFSSLFVGLMLWLNARERRWEVGMLRALGKSSASIAGLFMGKALLLGVLGGVSAAIVTWAIYGLAASGQIQSGIKTIEAYQPSFTLLGYLLIGAPFVAAMAGYLPTLRAVTEDPAKVLSEV